MNPLTLLDSILSDYASPKVRRIIHTTILLVAMAVTIYLGADKEWREALIALASAIYAGANKANTPAPEDPDDNGYYDPDYEDDDEDDSTYEDAGGLPYPDAEDEPLPYDEAR